MNSLSKKIVLVDDFLLDSLDSEDSIVIQWSTRTKGVNELSLPDYLEGNADQIRFEYLEWCFNLGNFPVKGKAAGRFFKINSYPSFLGMSLLREKSVIKNPDIYLIFKLRALELYIQKSKIRHLELFTNNRFLEKTIKNFCIYLGVEYSCESEFSYESRYSSSNRLRDKAPHFIQALLYWLRALFRYLLYFRKRESNCLLDRQMTVVSYFPNLDQDFEKRNIYRSHYWNELQEIFTKDRACNWVWMYANNKQYSLKEACKLKKRFQEHEKDAQKYFFIEEFLSFFLLLKAASIYFRVAFRSIFCKSIIQKFRLKNSAFDFWEILKDDWGSSFFGKVAMENSIRLVEFEALSKKIPKQELCIYLWENQGWERALVYSWKQYQASPIYGFQHSSIAYFDLRNFINCKEFGFRKDLAIIVPDLILVSGQRAMRLLINNYIPAQKVMPVESVRFLYLTDYDYKPKNKNFKKILLVVTGYSENLLNQQLNLLNEVMDDELRSCYDRIVIKPHPFKPINLNSRGFDQLAFSELSNERLKSLLEEADFVYSDNHTTAAVEALLMGKPLAVHVPNDFFNMSPLYHPDPSIFGSVNFVSTADQLKKALLNPSNSSFIESDYFFLDKGLSKWNNLLNEGVYETT